MPCRMSPADMHEALKVFREMVTERFKTKCVPSFACFLVERTAYT
jgi:hypothetical protein